MSRSSSESWNNSLMVVLVGQVLNCSRYLDIVSVSSVAQTSLVVVVEAVSSRELIHFPTRDLPENLLNGGRGLGCFGWRCRKILDVGRHRGFIVRWAGWRGRRVRLKLWVWCGTHFGGLTAGWVTVAVCCNLFLWFMLCRCRCWWLRSGEHTAAILVQLHDLLVRFCLLQMDLVRHCSHLQLVDVLQVLVHSNANCIAIQEAASFRPPRHWFPPSYFRVSTTKTCSLFAVPHDLRIGSYIFGVEFRILDAHLQVPLYVADAGIATQNPALDPYVEASTLIIFLFGFWFSHKLI